MMLYSIQPHMHLRGKSMKYTAVYPDGREEVLLNVPHYDFNWQIVYEFAKPVTLPAGTTIRVEATWDNLGQEQVQPEAGPGGLLGRAELGRDAAAPIIRTAVKLPSPSHASPARPASISSGSSSGPWDTSRVPRSARRRIHLPLTALERESPTELHVPRTAGSP